MPSTKEELCAVGVNGPTFYAEDAWAQSKTLAMTELARVLEVTVRSVLTVNSHGDNHGVDTSIHEVGAFATEAVLRRAQVREQWIHDGHESRYGEYGTVYTLVCMPIPR